MATKDYSRLDNALGVLRQRYGDRALRGVGIKTYVMAHAFMRDEGLELASAFHITDPQTRLEMRTVVANVLKPLDMNIFVLREKIGMGRMSYSQFAESMITDFLADVQARYTGDLDSSVKAFVENFNATLESEHIQDSNNIKAAVIYPQTISIMSTWLAHNNKFANNLINAIRSNEKVKEMKLAIDSIASVNPLYTIMRT